MMPADGVTFRIPLETFDLAVVIGIARRSIEALEPGKAECITRVRAKMVEANLLPPEP